MRSVTRRILVLAVVGACGFAASAQSEALLGGPKVERVSPPGMEKTFGMALANNPMVVRDSISMGAYLEMLKSIEGELALSEEQLAQAKGFEDAWRRRVYAYYATVMGQLEAVHEALPEQEAKRMEYMIRGGKRAIEQGYSMEPEGMELSGPVADAMSMTGMQSMDAMDPMSSGMEDDGAPVLRGAGDARGLLARIRRSTPLPWEEQSGIWSMLDEDQRDAMAERILAYRSQQRVAREEREMKRAAERRGDESIGPTLMERAQLLEVASKTGVLASFLHQQLPDDEREALDTLDPDERLEAVKTLASRMIAQETRGGQTGETQSARAAADGGKAAPSLDLLEIPADEEKKSTEDETPAGP